MDNRWSSDRTETFSDGVIAIAITLLVLEIPVPHGFDQLWRGILHEWPFYLGYVTSFITIGWIWLGHHAVFRRLQYVNSQLMRLNLVLLMAIAFLPYATKLMAESIRDRDAARTAVIFYGASLLAVSLLLTALWSTARRHRHLLRAEVSDEEVSAITRVMTPNILFYVAVIGLAIVAPRAAALGFLLVAALGVARARGEDFTA